MTMPRPGPDRSVSKENSANMAEMFEALSTNITALNETMRRTSEELSASLDMQGRYGFGPDTQLAYQARQKIGSHTPEITAQALHNMRDTFGITNDLTLGMTRLDPRQASTSLGHARAAMAQRLGETIAGGPLYSEAQGMPTSGPAGPPRPSGGPPVGQPTSGGSGGSGGGGGRSGGGRSGGGGGGVPPGVPVGGTGNWGMRYGGQNTRPNSSAMQALGARIATSGGQTDRLLHAVRHAPGIGLAADVIEGGVNQYQKQREAGRNYQEIEGGTNLGAQHERLHEETYRWSQYGGMSEQASREAFYGVTSLGYNQRAPQGTQQNRQSALDFVYHNYNARGMDVGESVNFLKTISQNASESLGVLSSAIKDVSDTAGKAGVNSQVLRQRLNENLGEAQTAGAGPGAPALAGALTSTQASYGKMFQNQNFGAQLNRGQMYMVGAKYGLSPGQTQTMMRTKPQEIARMISGNSLQVIKDLSGMSPDALADLKNIINTYGGAGTIDEAKATAIGNEWLNKWQPQNDIDLGLWSDLINQMTGLQLDPNSVMSWIVQQVAGNNEAAHAGSQKNAMAPVKTGKNGALASNSAPTGKDGLYTGAGTKLPGNSDSKYALDAFHNMNAPNHWWGVKGDNKAGDAYASAAKKSGTRDPVLEALLQNVQDPNGTHVQVSTKSGSRVVTFAEAMKSFPQELASGNAIFVDGPDAGRRPQDLTGGTIDTSRDISGEMKSGSNGKIGVSQQDWAKKHPQAAGGKTAAVTVDLTAEAKKLLQLLPSNNNPAAGAATVPNNPYAAYGSRGN
jgi:hypothetical protein